MQKLSLLIPIYNEQDNIPGLLQILTDVKWTTPVELVFVDDCSKDKSVTTLHQWLHAHTRELEEKKIEYQFHQQEVNRGKGAAIHLAIRKATGTILLVQDADSEYDPHEIPLLTEPILNNRADVVFGSRFLRKSGQTHRTYHYLINRTLTTLSNLFSGLYLSDMETCYKVFRADVLKNIQLKSERFGFEPEITAHLARLKARVWEIPISYYPRSYVEGKKITWKDGIAAFWHIFYFNWICSQKSRFLPTLPEKYLFKKWSDRYTGHSGRGEEQGKLPVTR